MLDFAISITFSVSPLITYLSSALDSFEPSLELCIQYKRMDSPTTTVDAADQVVGADGTAPNIIDTASVQSDFPCPFTARTRTKYFSPLDNPVIVYRGVSILLTVVDALDSPK